MSVDEARAVADAVLFEGYLLYPYRASALKNRMRWQFGVLAPDGEESEPSFARTECLLVAEPGAELEVLVRCLQLRTRKAEPDWDEGDLREVGATIELDRLDGTREIQFQLPGGENDRDRWLPLRGTIEVRTTPVGDDLLRLEVVVENQTRWSPHSPATREEMLRNSLISTHTVLAVRGGQFVSLLDPPEAVHEAVRACRNERTWPVLVGEGGRRDVVLSAPIILYDYPAIAPQSAGDLFDATEIDEILILRTMTLTDDEKREARETDPKAAAIIDRAEQLTAAQLSRMHGTMRYPDGRR
ncbi:hypothetical protein AB0I53_45015 [Saccharopolyspora sp. NPDC050389]|uniref:hypothetical protein n=1 Tax=Saccharopolyspora sp. NPDC050389 TaxID=3155516 RepID=UPI0033C0D558